MMLTEMIEITEQESVEDEIFLTRKQALERLFEIFKQKNKQLYIVGGALRDLLSGHEPKDFDLASDALPGEIESWFEKTAFVGKKFGTTLVTLGAYTFEITTMRKDSSYSDGRHPDHVCFTDSLLEDSRRRDFTVNALYMDGYGSIFDPCSGRRDLSKGIIRTVGSARRRFEEDRLRLWRALRLCAERSFFISPAVLEEMTLHPKTDDIAPERIQVELTRILCSDHPAWAGAYACTTGVFPQLIRRILPESEMDLQTLGESFRLAGKVPNDLALRLTALSLWMSDEECKTFISALRYPKRILERVRRYRRWVDTFKEEGKISFKRMLADLTVDEYLLLTQLQEEQARMEGNTESIHKAIRSRLAAQDIYLNGEPLHLSELAMSGSAVKAAGFKNEEIGEVLDRLLMRVYEDPSLNHRDTLTELMNEIKESYEHKENSRSLKTLPEGCRRTPAETDIPKDDKSHT